MSKRSTSKKSARPAVAGPSAPAHSKKAKRMHVGICSCALCGKTSEEPGREKADTQNAREPSCLTKVSFLVLTTSLSSIDLFLV